ncbi:MAG TPA: hypothetical protein PLB32_15355, partial [Acidobacteriota bacterium]|nr:hypothetical protein [Acidobacteriota bacterium]
MEPRGHSRRWSTVFALAQAPVDQTPWEIQGNDREELIGTSGCRLSPLLYGDKRPRHGGSSGMRHSKPSQSGR